MMMGHLQTALSIGNLIRGTYKSVQNTANRVFIFDWINAFKMVC